MLKSPDADRPLRPDTRPAVLPSEQLPRPPEHQEKVRPGQEETPRRHHLTVGSIAVLLFAVATAAVGQVMLKRGMQLASARSASSGTSLVFSAATSPWVLVGLVIFGLSAVAWLATLSRVPLSIAYPFNALGYLGILTASIFVLHERANVLTWAGTLLVVTGLIIVVVARP